MKLTRALMGLGMFASFAFSCAQAQDALPAQPVPSGGSASASTSTSTTYDPDPGAGHAAKPVPFYETPPGTTPDYGMDREPLLQVPPSEMLDVRYFRKDWQNRNYPEHPDLPPFTQAIPDRWALDIPTWRRYNNPDDESAYMYKTPRLFDPYKQSILKGDAPVLGQDYFLSLTGTSFTSYEARNVPTPSNVSSNEGQNAEFYGEGNAETVQQFMLLSIDFFKGETSFKPMTFDLHLEPVYNINYSRVSETGVLSPNPNGADAPGQGTTSPSSGNGGIVNPGDPGGFLGGGGGLRNVGPARLNSDYVDRTRDYFSLQQSYLEVHLADLSDNYDFVSMRIGTQPFNSDFRGFVFNDTNLGVRIFGNADNNKWQYNVAAFDMREKDTFSDLNTFQNRDQYVYIANVYKQDFLVPGYTGQLNFLANYDNGGDFYYNRVGVLTRPEAFGTIAPHAIRSYYFGVNGDGHIGRFNLTNSFYEVVGRDELNGLAGHAVNINAQMAAAELSYDVDWLRFKASFFYASGDDNPTDGNATGFDSIRDEPNFIGGSNSYFLNQGFNLGGTAVNFKNPQSLLPDLRSSKDEGQSNFVNPGVYIFGAGVDASIMPTLKMSLNANYIRMANVEPINTALQTNLTTSEIGWDFSVGAVYRPLLTDNIIISTGFGELLPGEGYKSIYETSTQQVPGYAMGVTPGHVDNFLYNAFVAVTLTY